MFPPEFQLTYLPLSAAISACLLVGAYGIGEVVTPVLDYLGCFYSSAQNENEDPSGGSSEGKLRDKEEETKSNSVMETELLELYRRVLDGHGAAPGP